jgi:molybdenum cofactor cytidylyltransferase
VVVNPRFAEGQSSSLRAGLAGVCPAAAAALVLLGDQPQVDAGVIRAVLAAFRAGAAPIVMPSYAGTPANPVLFARALFPEVMAVGGDQGARAVVLAHRPEVHLVHLPNRRPPFDVDTEADYAALKAIWRSHDGPPGTVR